MSAKKETYISFILEELKKGNVDYKNVMSVFVSKWQLSERQFVRHWNDANEAFKSTQEAINEQKSKEYTQSELERLKTNILDRDKIVEMQSNLVKLAYNKMVKIKEPTPSDLQAYNQTVERYSKLLGLDAPKQIEQKNIHELVGLGVEFVDTDITKD
jgi:hypothetical protein